MNITRLARDVTKCTRLLAIRNAFTSRAAVIYSSRKCLFHNHNRNFSVFSKSPDYSSEAPLMDLLAYETVSSETLEGLTDYFEELVEAEPKFVNADIAYSVSTLLITLSVQRFRFHNRNVYYAILGWCINSETWK